MPNSVLALVGLTVAALVAGACSGGGSATSTATPIQARPTTVATLEATTSASVAQATPSPTSPPTQPLATSTLPAATQPPTPAQQPSPAAGATTAPAPTSASASSEVALLFRATNNTFDRKVVRVRTGATVTATLQNDDAGTAHNLAFGVPGIPAGESCFGPCATTQTFNAGAPQTYFFSCSIHPEMFGSFIVDP